jgi:hypothetical protein
MSNLQPIYSFSHSGTDVSTHPILKGPVTFIRLSSVQRDGAFLEHLWSIFQAVLRTQLDDTTAFTMNAFCLLPSRKSFVRRDNVMLNG